MFPTTAPDSSAAAAPATVLAGSAPSAVPTASFAADSTQLSSVNAQAASDAAAQWFLQQKNRANTAAAAGPSFSTNPYSLGVSAVPGAYSSGYPPYDVNVNYFASTGFVNPAFSSAMRAYPTADLNSVRVSADYNYYPTMQAMHSAQANMNQDHSKLRLDVMRPQFADANLGQFYDPSHSYLSMSDVSVATSVHPNYSADSFSMSMNHPHSSLLVPYQINPYSATSASASTTSSSQSFSHLRLDVPTTASFSSSDLDNSHQIEALSPNAPSTECSSLSSYGKSPSALEERARFSSNPFSRPAVKEEPCHDSAGSDHDSADESKAARGAKAAVATVGSERGLSVIVCGALSKPYPLDESVPVSKIQADMISIASTTGFSHFFGKAVNVYTALADPLGRPLYSSSQLRLHVGCKNSYLSTYLKRRLRRLRARSGIFQASAVIMKSVSDRTVKVGGFFVSEDACKTFQQYWQRQQLCRSDLPKSTVKGVKKETS